MGHDEVEPPGTSVLPSVSSNCLLDAKHSKNICLTRHVNLLYRLIKSVVHRLKRYRIDDARKLPTIHNFANVSCETKQNA